MPTSNSLQSRAVPVVASSCHTNAGGLRQRPCGLCHDFSLGKPAQPSRCWLGILDEKRHRLVIFLEPEGIALVHGEVTLDRVATSLSAVSFVGNFQFGYPSTMSLLLEHLMASKSGADYRENSLHAKCRCAPQGMIEACDLTAAICQL
jgi:hypothetical protein